MAIAPTAACGEARKFYTTRVVHISEEQRQVIADMLHIQRHHDNDAAPAIEHRKQELLPMSDDATPEAREMSRNRKADRLEHAIMSHPRPDLGFRLPTGYSVDPAKVPTVDDAKMRQRQRALDVAHKLPASTAVLVPFLASDSLRALCVNGREITLPAEIISQDGQWIIAAAGPLVITPPADKRVHFEVQCTHNVPLYQDCPECKATTLPYGRPDARL